MDFVANFMCFPEMRNFESLLSFEKVTNSLRWELFSETQCSIKLTRFSINKKRRAISATFESPVKSGSTLQSIKA